MESNKLYSLRLDEQINPFFPLTPTQREKFNQLVHDRCLQLREREMVSKRREPLVRRSKKLVVFLISLVSALVDSRERRKEKTAVVHMYVVQQSIFSF